MGDAIEVRVSTIPLVSKDGLSSKAGVIQRKGKTYYFDAPEEFSGSPLARIQLGNLAAEFFERAESWDYTISEVSFKYTL